MVASYATQGIPALDLVNNTRGGMLDLREVTLFGTVRVHFLLEGIDMSHGFQTVLIQFFIHPKSFKSPRES